MATNEEFKNIYGALRSSLLSRHFPFGRYFRANHLALSNLLGTVHNNVQSVPSPDRNDQDDIEITTHDRKLIKPNAYASYENLQEQLKTKSDLYATTPQEKADAEKIQLERWRVGRYVRENPLMLTGQLLTCLAVEYYLELDRAGAKNRLIEVLATLASLCKFKGNHFDGYMIRWDPVTSDLWVTGKKEVTNPKTGKKTVEPDPRYCCEFLVGSDGKYLYSTPLNDPRYTPFNPEWEEYARRSDFSLDPVGHADSELDSLEYKAYDTARKHSINFYRSWEPSQDELIGLVMGYDIVFRLVDDEVIRGKILDQVNNLGDYLAENGYLLVRPGGGFTARGASGFSVCLEFPFGQVFKRITDDHNPYRSRVGFEGALGKAGLWESLKGPLTWGTIGGIVIGGGLMAGLGVGLGSLLLGPLAAFSGGVTLGTLGTLGGLIIGRATALYLHRNVFDVENNDQQVEFILAYLLKKWPSIKQRFQIGFLGLKSGTGYATGFPPWIGLTGLDDEDQAVRNAYIDWFLGRRESGLGPFEKGFGPLFKIDSAPQEWIDLLNEETIPELLRLHFVDNNIHLAPNATVSRKDKGIRWWIQNGQQMFVLIIGPETLLRVYEKGTESCFAQAVAVILGAGLDEEKNLVQLLQKRYDKYQAIWEDFNKTTWKGDLTLEWDEHEDYNTDDDKGTPPPVVIEDIKPDLDFMAALALAWLHTRQRSDHGTPVPAEIGFPTVPDTTTKWQPATIPGYVYDAATNGSFSLPLDTIKWDGEIRPDEIDVFGGGSPTSKSEVPAVKQKSEDEKQLVFKNSFPVRESGNIVDTGIDILPEDTIIFKASGEIWSGVWLTGSNTPDGWNNVDHDLKFPLHDGPDAHPYCLLARIGRWGSWMFVGVQLAYKYPIDGEPGRLYLRINDDSPGNGNGKFDCEIQVKR